MSKEKLDEHELSEICEDAFINVKEACYTLQEKTKCSNQVVIEMLNNVIEFYKAQSSN